MFDYMRQKDGSRARWSKCKSCPRSWCIVQINW
jgi:hypothetical protein